MAVTAPDLDNKKAVELYRTNMGSAFVTLAEDYLPRIEGGSVDLVVTSPPFALLREKAYGNREQGEYVDWLVSFAPLVWRVLKDTGSFVMDLGGAYQRGVPVRSLYNYRVLLRMCDEYWSAPRFWVHLKWEFSART